MRRVRRSAGGVVWFALLLCAGLPAPVEGRDGAVNRPPEVTLHFAGNRTFLWPGAPLGYVAIASDPEDGDTLAGTIDPARVAVAFQRLPPGEDAFVPPAVDTRTVAGMAAGKALIAKSNCILCHTVAGERPIPTYTSIAEVNEGAGDAVPRLAAKIIKGGSGVWGTTVMPPHPSLSRPDAEAMVRYILALVSPEGRTDWLPARGTIAAAEDQGPGRHVLWASYTDKGGPGGAKTARAVAVFRPPVLLPGERDGGRAVRDVEVDGLGAAVVAERSGAHLRFRAIDLTGLGRMSFRVANARETWAGGSIELRIDSPFGPSLGRVQVETDGGPGTAKTVDLNLAPARGLHDLYLVLRGHAGSRRGAVALGAIAVEP